jgi:hypothetical protein
MRRFLTLLEHEYSTQQLALLCLSLLQQCRCPRHACTLTPMTDVRKPYLYEYLRRIKPADFEIHEVTTNGSLSTGTSSTTESIAPLIF